MEYIITFFEGIISFVSPCMLPMLPVYISYFSAGNEKRGSVFLNSLGFVFGFTAVFCILGVFAGTAGAALTGHRRAVEIICGALVIVFGLAYLEIIPLRFLKGMNNAKNAGSVISAFIFGVVYSVSLTPCVGAFLGSALMLAASVGGAAKGLSLLLLYSLGLGIPFVLSALVLDKLKNAFAWIKRHYKVINTVGGIFLISVGVLMAAGLFGRLTGLLS